MWYCDTHITGATCYEFYDTDFWYIETTRYSYMYEVPKIQEKRARLTKMSSGCVRRKTRLDFERGDRKMQSNALGKRTMMYKWKTPGREPGDA